jgi:hypothetical protein
VIGSGNDSHDSYHDDPVEPISPKRKKTSILAALVLFAVGGFYLQSTLAANLSINSGSRVEFGQATSQAVACSGEHLLTLTLGSSFTNGSPGAHYLNSVTVSEIPESCYGVDFIIRAYDDTSNIALALFHSTSTAAVINDNGGNFEAGTGSIGMTVESSAGTFTATFTTPVAQSSNVFKLTIQSGVHTPLYSVGNTGPGGGFVYYVDTAGFKCGAAFISTGSPTGGLCHYLEVAPNGWNTGSDTKTVWATGTASAGNAIADISTITNENPVYNNALGIGIGYKNSSAIVIQNNAGTTYAAGAARAYTGGSQSDWYLPSSAELNLLCQWDRGVAPSVTTACTGGDINSAIYGAGLVGIKTDGYWSSSEHMASMAWSSSFYNGTQNVAYKHLSNYVRPIRAF